jgi:hypothetical protein
VDNHPAAWWAQFSEVSDRFDLAMVTEGMSDLIIPKIGSPLLRREAELAADVVVRSLNKPSSEELAVRARQGTDRLVTTVRRLQERSISDDTNLSEAWALCHALEGHYDEAAAELEPVVGTVPLMKAFVAALRLERFDMALALRLLKAGQRPELAVRSGLAAGKYNWWPTWLLTIVTERALLGELDQATITALDRCAYAELSPAQARVARRLLNGDEMMIDASADRLEAFGERDTARRLREGDLSAVALAARLIPIH